MTLDEILSQVRELLERERRVAYRILKRRFALTDDDLEDLKADLIDAKRLATDEDGKVLVWVGASLVHSSTQPLAPNTQPLEAERRQLTVMFCDLVGSTALSAQLDPEELREVVRGYQQTSATVIKRFDGHIAQYLGDGLLVYFGYPVAHEDDAARAVRAGLAIIEAIRGQGSGIAGQEGLQSLSARLLQPLQVRIGIHTGPVVVGEMGGGARREQLALGETPNIAARIQGYAEPDAVFISAATYRLVEGLFECEARGQPTLKGVATPLTLYCVLKEGEAQSRFQVVARKGLTPLVGREHEFGLLCERWERVKDGEGQVVLLSGEPGIGKSRLVEALKDSLKHEGARCLELQCSPYHQNSALYPVIEHVQRVLQFQQTDSPEEQLHKLENARVGAVRESPRHADVIPLLAALLSLPHPKEYPPLSLSPQKQKEKTYEALVAWFCAEAKQQAMTYAWEDLHWADPSTLEFLTLFLEQVPTTRLLAVLTFRPEFIPPWDSRSYLSQLILSRLNRSHVEMMVEKVTGEKVLPVEVVQQIVSKTDGVPLFVEELTKTVLESTGSIESIGFAIPATLQDSLMARLDRLGAAKEIAQVGATIGREFAYELLQAVSSLTDETLQQGLRQLIEAELVYQSGRPPQATYLFKHALIQDTAYLSLLKGRRQQLHQQVVQVLAERFPQTVETQPELLAHHYTEAGLIKQAIPYWQGAGQRALERSANSEAIGHLTQGLGLLKALPDTPDRMYQELMLQIILGTALMATRGYGAPEVKEAYTRALGLCRQLRETSRLLGVVGGLLGIYQAQGELRTARELGEQYLTLAQRERHPTQLVWAHNMRGENLSYLGEFALGREHLEQSMALYDPQKHRFYIRGGVHDPGVACLGNEAMALWYLGYPNQALEKIRAAISLAQELSHSLSLARALDFASLVHQYRREGQAAQEQAEAMLTVCTEQGFPFFLAHGTIVRGWALAEQGQGEEGISQIRQGLVVYQSTGGGLFRPYFLALLAEACGKMGQCEEGLALLTKALTAVDKNGERYYETELYRLKGELTLQSQVESHKSKVEEAEACFHKAIEIARQQQAKSLELRATTSLARLWQQPGKKDEARQMLADIYTWFTEGFDTKDLQEAKTLLEELSH